MLQNTGGNIPGTLQSSLSWWNSLNNPILLVTITIFVANVMSLVARLMMYKEYCFTYPLHLNTTVRMHLYITITSEVQYATFCSLQQICKKLLCINPVTMESVSRKPEAVTCASIIYYALWPLCFIFRYATLVTQCYKRIGWEAILCYVPCIVSKKTGTQRRTKVSPWYMYCTYCSWQKGMSRDKVTSSSENPSL